MRIKSRSTLAALAGAALTIGTLAACTGDDGEDRNGDDRSETETEETETVDEDVEEDDETEAVEEEDEDDDPTVSDVEEDSDDNEAPAGDVTESGAELSVGETATVPFVDSDGNELLTEVTITSIDEMTMDDLEAGGLEPDDAWADMTPFYVNYEATAVQDGDYSGVSVGTDIDGFVEGGNPAQRLTTIGFRECGSANFTSSDEQGDSIEGCQVYLTDGESVTSAQLVTGDDDYTVTWS